MIKESFDDGHCRKHDFFPVLFSNEDNVPENDEQMPCIKIIGSSIGEKINRVSV